MNRSFKSVFNRRTGTWQVVSEKVRNAGKTGNSVSKPLLAMVLGLSASAGMAQTSFDNLLVGVGGNGAYAIDHGTEAGGGGIGGGGSASGGGGGGISEGAPGIMSSNGVFNTGGAGGTGSNGALGGSGGSSSSARPTQGGQGGLGGGGTFGAGGGGALGGAGGRGISVEGGRAGIHPNGSGEDGESTSRPGYSGSSQGGGGSFLGGGGGGGNLDGFIRAGGGGGGKVVNANGENISASTSGGGAGGNTSGPVGVSDVSLITNRDYGYVGIGGGGGGAAISTHGGSGSAGRLSVDNAELTIHESLLIGGAGGGGSAYSGGVGGRGGNGQLVVQNYGIVTVANTILIGGSAGGGPYGGGFGGSGTLTLEHDSHVKALGDLIIGGSGFNGGNGTLNLAGRLDVNTAMNINRNGTLNIGNATIGEAIAGTISSPVNGIVNNGRINFNQSDTEYIFDASITGTGSVTQNNNGKTILTANSTYTGGTTVNAGTLAISNMGALGTGDVTLNNGAELLATVSGTESFGQLITSNGRLSAATGTTFNVAGFSLGTLGVGGTLHIGSAGNTGTVSLARADNASISYPLHLAVDHGTFRYGDYFAGRITIYGRLSVAADATVDLNGQNVLTTYLDGAGHIESQTTGAASLTVGTNYADASPPSTFSGVIANGAGTVSLIKTGANTLTLSGSNTYTGGTTVDAGTLALSGAGQLASSGRVNLASNSARFDISNADGNRTIGGLDGVAGSTVTLGANTLTVGTTTDHTFAGTIDGSGGIVKQGIGTFTLNGTNTYTGGTTINAGTLALGAGGNLVSTGSVSIADGATFDLRAKSNTTIGDLSGAGNVALGTGRLTLGSSNNTTFAGDITGSGAQNHLIKQGTGTLTLTGNATIGGNLQINNGAIEITNGGRVSNTDAYIDSNAVNVGIMQVTGTNSTWTNTGFLDIGYSGNAVLFIDQGGSVSSSDTMLAATQGSTAQLSLMGTAGSRGTLSTGYVMKGAGTGLLQWDGGILQATGNEQNFFMNFAHGDIDIQGNGAFFDTQGFTVGILSTDILDGQGSLTKLGSGTLTIAGENLYAGDTTVAQGTLQFDTYKQTANQTLGIGVTDTTNYGKLNVTGTATFDANAKINVDVASLLAPVLAAGNVLTDVIKAGTLNASSFTVSDNSALFNFDVVQHLNSVDLRVVSNSASGIQDGVGEYGIQSAQGAAQVLDNLLHNGTTGDMSNVINALGQLPNNRDVARAAAQTLPVISGNQAIQGALTTFQRLVQSQTTGGATTSGLSSGDALANKNAWGKVFGSRAEQDDRSGAAGFKADTWGLALGADAQVAPGTRFGVAYGYAKTSVNGNADLSGTAQRANIGSHVTGAYGSKELGNNRTFSFQGDIGMNDNKSTRHIDFGGLNRTARADYRTYSAHIGAAISQASALNETTTLTPSLRADYTWLKSQGYTESGANALNLTVGSNKTDAFVIGADAYLQHRFSHTARLDANVGIGYDAINERGNIVAAYAGAPGQSFMTTGIDHSPWLIRGGIGYNLTTANGTEISFRYDAEGRSDYLNHTASVRAKWAF